MCYLNLGLCFNLVLDSYKYMDISFALKAWGGNVDFYMCQEPLRQKY